MWRKRELSPPGVQIPRLASKTMLTAELIPGTAVLKFATHLLPLRLRIVGRDLGRTRSSAVLLDRTIAQQARQDKQYKDL